MLKSELFTNEKMYLYQYGITCQYVFWTEIKLNYTLVCMFQVKENGHLDHNDKNKEAA